MKLTSEERKNKILHEVITKGEISINQLADELGVTTETIRKDVSFLDEKNLIEKKHGLVTKVNTFFENEFSVKENTQLPEKIKVAEMALNFIPENAAILLDTSTTVLQLAKLLVMRDDLTIVTNSLQISQVLANSDNQILLTGGLYRKKSNSYVGDWAIQAIKEMNLDVAFLGCDGFSATGPTIRSYQELEIKKIMVEQSKKNIVLADSAKLKNTGLYSYVDYQNLDVVIVERNLTEVERQAFPEELFFYTN
ncbi:DeoR/GlpR family DNA-binding transcription regulator [Enterococcus sp. ALS3]|uniref:DeoR/GlpR family DNA-binding transcription regulator n=1 Tax=Enterococcus alishanensis TaxID=1303817 RepID=A0ABS6TGG1_9ENTE|nr:DeoR/GlpR family DNA-binding transcription regulator [Enterococcus alishanensis]MBV7391899.1 DeoR/GlpR family DNA-binding transcription regulator [Enterococcus alishanensis]